MNFCAADQRHLPTHTAGFSYDFWNTDVARYMSVTGVPGIIGCARAALTTPLVADPGERWEYGINIDWLGQLVEAVSGQTLDIELPQAPEFEIAGRSVTITAADPAALALWDAAALRRGMQRGGAGYSTRPR